MSHSISSFPSIDSIHPAAERLDAVRVHLRNPHHIPATLFASDQVPIERDGIEQALGLLDVQRTIERLRAHEANFFGELEPAIERLVLTPDFHPGGGGIPVGSVLATRGFILPQAVGNDICCGMRLLVIKGVSRHELARNEQAILSRLRQIFFEGQRDIAMSPLQREAMLREGLVGLLETFDPRRTHSAGWSGYDRAAQERDLARSHLSGSLPSSGVFAFEDFIMASGSVTARDSQIGSVGGGNHFVEIQSVEAIEDNLRAHAWGLAPGDLTLMVHSGSVGLGRRVGQHFMRLARERYPTGLAHPENGFYPLAQRGPRAALFGAYLDAMKNAANFAFANRLFLGLMARRALSEVLGRELEATLLHDAPHNLIWSGHEGDEARHVHRKGACPAYGPSLDAERDPFAYTGPPVIVPGSMGDVSYLLAGEGNAQALCSACHGAGRKVSRQRARREEAHTVDGLRVVTPLDLDGQMLREHAEIRERQMARLREESPASYKDVTPVVDTIDAAHIASKVARLRPWLTIKSL